MDSKQAQTNGYRVLLIEDDPMVQEVNRQFIENVTGFRVEGIASNGAEGLKLARELEPDLVFLDMFMPVQDGAETLRQIRAEALHVDVIVVTAAKDLPTVKQIMQKGVFDYIIKPFKFERIESALEQYRAYRMALHEERQVTQAELDVILRSKASQASSNIPVEYHRGAGSAVLGQSLTNDGTSSPTADNNLSISSAFAIDIATALPKGLQASTMRQIVQFLLLQRSLLTAEEVADGVGLARVTARRYLDYLVQSGSVRLDIRYGNVGRPVNRYGLISTE
ncbi:response regulator [Paenibacillus sp. SC116]|uniref:response regulator transcription factor n=1 Tax=Paenibacillus sp. SC116 TaxID=2968986 RepID=UPI00215B6524|nr:response regulator [Paenibacillus sp. SC116]MCR8842433.1 response regulator [Paenibacillus sp. SC116]